MKVERLWRFPRRRHQRQVEVRYLEGKRGEH